MSIRLTQSILVAGSHVPVNGETLSLNPALEADLVNGGKAVYVSNPSIGGRIPVDAEYNEVTGGIEVPKVVVGKTSANLASAPTAADIAFGDSTMFYDIADPTKRYAMNAGHTAFVAAAGGGGGGVWGAISGTLSAQTDLVTALGLKANTSAISAAGLSGSYNDLSNKPTIPAQFNPVAGANITLSGTYPSIEFSSTGSGGSAVSQVSSLSSAIAAYKAGLRTRPPVIFGIGDSNFTGQGAGNGSGTITYLTNAFASAPMQQIKTVIPTLDGCTVINTALFGEGNITALAAPVSEYDPRITLGTDWAPSGVTGTIGGRWYQSSTTIGEMVINFGQRIDVVELYFGQSTTGSTSVQVLSSDNTVIGTYSCNAGAKAFSSVTLTNAKFNDGIVKIKNNSTGVAYVFGIIAYPTDANVCVVAQGSWSSGKVADYAASVDPWNGVLPLNFIKPDYTIIQLMLNDVNQGTAAATWGTSMATVLDIAVKHSDTVLSTGMFAGVTNYTNGAYKAIEFQQEKTAASYGCATINLHRRFVSYAAANAAGLQYDTLHQTAAGYAIQAQTLAKKILSVV